MAATWSKRATCSTGRRLCFCSRARSTNSCLIRASAGTAMRWERPSFYHTWYLKPQGDACLVVTDEVGKGEDAAHLRETDESLMHRGHDLWLATLKWVEEGKGTAACRRSALTTCRHSAEMIS